MFEAEICQDTVSILHAVFFGAGEACVDIGVMSLLGGVAVFLAAVVALRIAGSFVLLRIWSAVRGTRSTQQDAAQTPAEDGLKRLPYESPIRSTGAWGGKAR